ncbi:protein of unknown function [Chitinophaga costaii]|uniref:DUF2024 domain-containing protein n=1 Tax=Chitinophaga costaii TaxID=1335309 RepID=A0A1C4B1F4_9BACT|nr:DUF2024 family protein [Chitinophaga costaii]PUZ26834.1 DUF2024 domain-containing protein [Chitinophaga costaii]SCC00657.1 protein of unknown function [Chitinophaga costaii]
MKVAIFDTYIPRKNGGFMHFDIITPADTSYEQALIFAQEYLRSKSQPILALTCKECKFCHLEQVVPSWKTHILRQGYYVHELKGCN